MAAPNKLDAHKVGVLFLAVAWSAAIAQEAPRGISIEAGPVTVDLRANTSVLKDVAITDGRVSIQAGEATSTGDQTAEHSWQLSDGVRIAIDSARLSGDAATFRLSAGQFTDGEVIGDPVTFEMSPGANGAPIHGTASKISYDRGRGVLSATGNASFAAGAQEFACDWTFYLEDRTWSGVPEGDKKCVMRIPIRGVR